MIRERIKRAGAGLAGGAAMLIFAGAAAAEPTYLTDLTPPSAEAGAVYQLNVASYSLVVGTTENPPQTGSDQAQQPFAISPMMTPVSWAEPMARMLRQPAEICARHGLLKFQRNNPPAPQCIRQDTSI